MPLPTYSIKVAGNTVSNVQEFTISQGRQKVSDPLRAGTGTIRGRRPDLLPAIALGDEVRIEANPGVFTNLYFFRVSDFRIIYGYIASMDEWEIELEDQFAILGRAVIGTSWSAGSSTFTAANAVATNCGITMTETFPSQSTVSAQVIVNQNALELMSTIATTEQARFQIRLAAGVNNMDYLGRGWQQDLITYDVSDDGTGTNPIKYDGLDFYGLADNYADKVVINAVGLAQQSAGVGNYSLELPSYNQTTGDAASLASYLLGVFDAQDDQPAVLTTKQSLQTDDTARIYLGSLCNPLAQAKIKFRGTTYYAIIEGWTITGYPEDMLFTYYLSSPAFFPVFILDDTQFGVLDTNRLGY